MIWWKLCTGPSRRLCFQWYCLLHLFLWAPHCLLKPRIFTVPLWGLLWSYLHSTHGFNLVSRMFQQITFCDKDSVIELPVYHSFINVCNRSLCLFIHPSIPLFFPFFHPSFILALIHVFISTWTLSTINKSLIHISFFVPEIPSPCGMHPS